MIWLFLVAGALGAMLRLVLDRFLVPTPNTSASPWRGWPIGILLANAGGALLLGLTLGYARSHGVALTVHGWSSAAWPEHWVWLVATGFCGSLSTVSTLFVGVDALFAQLRSRAWLYLGTSLLLGFLAGALGVWVGSGIG